MKDHRVEIYSTDGQVTEVMATAEETRFYDDLPFNSGNVSSTHITEPRG